MPGSQPLSQPAVWIPLRSRSILLIIPPGMAAQPAIGKPERSALASTPSRMRILNAVQSYFPFQDRGGPVVKVRALARGLAQRGHQITVLTADLGLAKLNASTMRFQRCSEGWRAEEDGVESVYLSTLAHYRALTFNPDVVAFCRASLRQFDLVHFYGLYDLFGPAVSYFCRRQGVPYVIEPMGMYRPIDRSFRMKRVWHSSLGGSYWSHAAQIVATSEMEQQELFEDGVPSEKLVVRYNGIDRATSATQPARGAFRAQWGIPPAEPLLLFLGRLIPRKGADLLIDAFAEACPTACRLVIAGPEGEPGYLELLAQRAREAGVASRVIFTGPLYDDAKTSVMADSDVFVLPSRYENFANSAAEAIACGVPVIITDACGIRSLVDGRAGLVIAPEQQALANAIRALLSDRSLYEKLRAGCPAVAAELDWDRLTEQMEGYYARALGSSNGHN
jgi:glycosyltransferase involved in cell wall biosynthesis